MWSGAGLSPKLSKTAFLGFKGLRFRTFLGQSTAQVRVYFGFGALRQGEVAPAFALRPLRGDPKP